ncbi:hypothetical protein RIE95_14535 [Acidithiobacillus thiooxidans]|uniref:hypothetical protein n=1 Tax=Acidithiobacillus thiooxidans TaxID=930 RepID=UPI0028587913|nr:hypothetical protein [Acidithiobacillus thiooxidans]MDR7928188.1 hypothetical protein [Acidithiobacillus thiooxidans]
MHRMGVGLILLLLLLLIGMFVFWFIGGPRIVLEEILATRLQAPVHLQANPRFYWGKQQLQVTLQGLRIGTQAQPRLQLRRLMLSLLWRPLLTGQVKIQQIFLDQPSVYGPWPASPGSATSSTNVNISLPGDVQIRDGRLHWTGLAGHALQLSDVQASFPRSGAGTATGRWFWNQHAGQGRLQMDIHSTSEISLRNLQLLIGTRQVPDALSLQMPRLEIQDKVLQIPALQVRWQDNHERRMELSMQDLQAQPGLQKIVLRSATLQAGSDFHMQIDHARFSWAQWTGQAGYVLSAEHLPELAKKWGLSWPKLTNPKVPRYFKMSGKLAWKNPRFDWSIRQGLLDSSPWSGNITGTWQPLKIHLALQIQRLNLGAYLPAPKAGPGAVLPKLPATWPITGSLQIGQLIWGKIRAENVLIRSRKP